VKIFITGASTGLGAALARRYAARGAILGLFSRREAALEALCASLAPARCAAYPGDVRDAQSVRVAAAGFIGQFGAPDIVVANAGISVGTSSEHAEDASVFAEVVDTNLTGLVHTFQPFIAPMRAAGAGRLVGIASVAGFRGLPGAGAYSASKAGAIAYLESLRVEVAGTGVRVVTVCPGYIATDMTARNPYRMPFLLDVDDAARRIAAAIDRGGRFYVIPWQMALLSCVFRALPRPLYDAVFARAARKPRRGA
jgi:NAD(P)-dependent dehydrogenase (short-subunit alcohol dehydrogenase family)